MQKIFFIAAVIAVAHAVAQHGSAYSSQSIVLQGGHGYQQQAPLRILSQYQSRPATYYQHQDDQHVDFYAHPQYSFEYKVQDPHTGDNKYQHETRDGDVVQGVYSLLEADGTVRTVEYSADKHTGFNAIVRREGHAQHVQPAYNQHY